MPRQPLVSLHDLPAAIGLLTRLPVRVDTDRAAVRGARAGWAYPLVGVLVAGIAAALHWAAVGAGLPPGLAALIALLALVVLTGALHEDGLADSIDGLWGGWTRDRRLEIMKDSHIGSYGVIGLVASLGLRGAALAALPDGMLAMVLVAVAAMSRAAMVALWAALPSARSGGLAGKVGRPGTTTAILALLIGAGVCLWALSPVAALVTGAAALTGALCVGAIARAKIGGQTGDILGATQQVSEIAALLVLVAVFA